MDDSYNFKMVDSWYVAPMHGVNYNMNPKPQILNPKPLGPLNT
jgi:hypothetical protein